MDLDEESAIPNESKSIESPVKKVKKEIPLRSKNFSLYLFLPVLIVLMDY